MQILRKPCPRFPPPFLGVRPWGGFLISTASDLLFVKWQGGSICLRHPGGFTRSCLESVYHCACLGLLSNVNFFRSMTFSPTLKCWCHYCSDMVKPTEQETMATGKTAVIPRPQEEGLARPCRDHRKYQSGSGGRGEGREHGREPLLWFPQEGQGNAG